MDHEDLQPSRLTSNATAQAYHPMLPLEQKFGLSFVLHQREDGVHTPEHGEPVYIASHVPVICFHGSGQHTHYEGWVKLVQEMANFMTVLYYERREASQARQNNPRHRGSQQAVTDLDRLLKHLHLKPPYILLAHSHGGTVAREFLQRHPERVAGMVLAETGQETPTDYDEEQLRTQILGHRPLSVIHADSLRGLRVAGVSDEGRRMQQAWAREDERLKKAQLRLSSNARYVRVGDCGHHVVRDRPGVVVEELKWVLANLIPPAQRDTRGGWPIVRLIGRLLALNKGPGARGRT